MSKLIRSFGLLLLIIGIIRCSASPSGLPSRANEAPSGAEIPADPDLYTKPQNAPEEEKLIGEGDASVEMTSAWPSFRGAQRDGISLEKNLINEFADSGPRVIWSRTLLGGYSSVAVADGRVITQSKRGNNELVQAFDAANGKKLWETPNSVSYADHFEKNSLVFTRAPSGPRSTPAIDGDRVYALGTTGTLLALDVKTGKILWQKDLQAIAGKHSGPFFGYCNSPLVFGDSIYVMPGSFESGKKGTAMAAFHKISGEVQWMVGDDPYSYSSPQVILHGKKSAILFFTGAGAVAVTPETGSELWRHPWTTQENQNTALPIYSEGKLFLSSSYSSGKGALVEVTEPQTKVVWENKNMKNHFASSVLYEGHLYGFSESRLRCVEFETGKVKWDKAGFGKGSLIIADGKLIILSEQGEVVLASASADSFQELSRAPVLTVGQAWNIPALANGILYVRNEWSLVAIDLRKP